MSRRSSPGRLDPPDRDAAAPPATVDVGVQVNMTQKTTDSNNYCLRLPRWLVWLGAVAVGLLAIYLGADYVVSLYRPRWQVDPATMEDMGVDGVVMFRKHDRDNDGVLSLDEFEPLAHQLLEHDELHTYDDHIEDWDDVITITTEFSPLKLDTMTKDMQSSPGQLDGLVGLRAWSKPVSEWKNFGGSNFLGFLPADSYLQESVGEVYSVLHDMSEHSRGAQHSSNRYNPPQVLALAEVTLHRLLAMLHPRPFVYARFAPQGTVATVRAFNNNYLHIVFRAHMEFQLNEPPFYPFWFTPAQFMGDLIIQRDGHKVLFFSTYVPNNNRLNVDMEWLNNPHDAQNMEVDIGYMPAMALRSSRSSVHAFHAGTDQRGVQQQKPVDDNYETSLEEITWTKEISEAEARRKLELKMYPFKEIQYYNFTSAFEEAGRAGRPVHSVLLWGALDDQSC